MKCAHTVSLLEEQSVPFGLVLGWGWRAQHEHGIDRLASDLGLRMHKSGMLLTCNRAASTRLLSVSATIDGIENTLMWWDEYFSKPASTPSVLVQEVGAFERLWSDLPDEQRYRKGDLRGAWSDSSFLVHAKTAPLARKLAMLAASFKEEDLAVAYGVDALREIGLLNHVGPALVMIAPGLCPQRMIPAVARAQRGLLERKKTKNGRVT